MLMLLAMLVLLLHIMMLTWLRQSMDLPKAQIIPVPFKLEVNLLGKNGLKTSVTPSPAKSQPKPEPKPEPKPKPKPKKTSFAKEKLPDAGDIEQLIKSRPAKLVSKSVKYQPEQQTAQMVSSAMMLPPAGSTSAIDNFPVSDSHNPSPEYPEMAIFLGYQGTAVIRIKVSAQGVSKGVEILRSSGHKILDESAAKALKKWRFTPSKNDNDNPMTDSVIISVIYILYGNNN
ncbi:MAG: energy transducer TonB [Methylococcaceae bacterium]